MKQQGRTLRLTTIAAGLLACAATALSQTAPPPITQEIEATLFILKPDPPANKTANTGPFANKTAVTVVWIPQPIQKYCIGKTHKECATLDFCIRTTSKSVAMCRNLPVDINHFPAYPADSGPRRMLSVIMLGAYNMPGFDALRQFVENSPAGSLDHFSQAARIKAKVKFTRTADDDDFKLVEVLAGPPL